MSLTEADIDAFGQFAKQHIHVGASLSLEELLAKWTARQEAEQLADDIRQGLKDIEAGRGQPAAVAFADVREELGRRE